MKDGPDKYLFRKDGKQKLVGSADNSPEDGEEELEESGYRYEREEEERLKTLRDIQYIISQEAPAVFLYSPTYYIALSSKVQNASFENLATTSDRFAAVETWYAKVDRKLKEGTNPLTFFSWIAKQF